MSSVFEKSVPPILVMETLTALGFSALFTVSMIPSHET